MHLIFAALLKVLEGESCLKVLLYVLFVSFRLWKRLEQDSKAGIG